MSEDTGDWNQTWNVICERLGLPRGSDTLSVVEEIERLKRAAAIRNGSMSEMVERVARATREAVQGSPERSVSFEGMSRIVARAAIEAMREPSHELTLRAVEAIHRFAHSHDVEFYRFHGVLAPDAQRVYQERIAVGFSAMIDAALSDPE